MFIYKILLFYGFLIIKSSLCVERDYTKLFIVDESSEDYIKRMNDLGLPYIGQPYTIYAKEIGETSAISPDEYKILMNSIPRIYETMDSVNDRNQLEGLQKYNDDVYKYLVDRIPLLPESYEEYVSRLKSNDISNPFIPIIFEGFKRFCPLPGDISYANYENRMNLTFNLMPFDENDYTSFLYLLPYVGEKSNKYLERCNFKRTKDSPSRWRLMNEQDYKAFSRLIPSLIGECYEEYKNRINKLGIIPMEEKYFAVYKQLIPNLEEEYDAYVESRKEIINSDLLNDLKLEIPTSYTFQDMMFKIPYMFETEKYYMKLMESNGFYVAPEEFHAAQYLNPKLGEYRFEYTKRIESTNIIPMSESLFQKHQSLYSFIHESYPEYKERLEQSTNILFSRFNKDAYDLMIKRYPTIFESKNKYMDRMKENDFIVSDDDYYFAKRIFPKLVETHLEYCNRQSEMNLMKLDITKFNDFKRNYPQINYTYIELTKDVRNETGKVSLVMNKKEFQDLRKKIPLAYESYSLYKAKMERKLSDPMEEEDFHDFKKVFIGKFESYDDYVLRMDTLGIPAMTKLVSFEYKTTIPSSTISYDLYKENIPKSDYIKNFVFDYISFIRFQLVFPKSHEDYQMYVERIQNHIFNLEFEEFAIYNEELLTEVENDNYEILQIKLEPLDEYQFLDLKLEYPKTLEGATDGFVEKLKNIFTANESIDDYINRMKKISLPFVGQSYEDYVKNTVDKDLAISLDEYKILMNSIPRLYETIGSVNERNSHTEGLQIYTEEIFINLITHYPLLHENYQTYLKRMDNNGILDPIPRSMFIALKNVCPNHGEPFIDYVNRSNEFNFTPFEYSEYESFLNLIPSIEEELNNYLSRCKYDESKLINDPTLPSSRWKIMNKNDYMGLYLLNTKIGEYFEEYTLRIKDMDIIPMTKEYFNLYQSIYPNFEDYYYNQYYREIEKLFDIQLIKDLNIDIVNQVAYNRKLIKIPYIFETFKMYEERMEKNGNFVDLHDYYYGRRLNPCLGEYFVEYEKRLKNTHVRIISENTFALYQNLYANIDEDFSQYLKKREKIRVDLHADKLDMYDRNAHEIMINFIPNIFESRLLYIERMVENDFFLREEEYYKAKRRLPLLTESYVEFCQRQQKLYIENILSLKSFTTFKQNYPQIGYTYIDLHDDENKSFYNKPGDLGERFIRLNERDFEKLKKKLPFPYENYAFYEIRIHNASDSPLEEIDFDDFKKVDILQSEAYTDYLKRMSLLCIKPMAKDVVSNYKKIVPREVMEDDYNTYKLHIYLKDLGLEAFDRILYLRFQLLHPFALESYNTYVKRIKNHLFNRDFSAFCLENEKLLKITNTQIDDDDIMLKINLEPLKEYEFLDLKKRFPFLRETHDNYLTRLKFCNLEPIIIERIFKCYKSAVIYVNDSYEDYKSRIDFISKKDIQRLRIKILDKEGFNYHLSIQPYVYEMNYSSYTKSLNGLNTLDEYEYHDKKSIYPIFYQTKPKYDKLMEERKFDIVSKIYFDTIKKGIPRLLENYMTYNIRINSINKKQLSDQIYILKECSEERFNEMKSVFVPRLGQTMENYVEKVSNSKRHFIDFPEINEIKVYFLSVIELYPKFTDSIQQYNKQNDTTYVPWLVMNDEEFSIFFKTFPRQFENFMDYQKRVQIHKTIITEDDFNYFQNMFPLLTESYEEYILRMESYGRTPESNDLFRYFKSIVPELEENFITYSDRINKLTDSKVLKLITVEKNHLFNVLAPQILNEYEFRTFKERLPLPNEDYTVYTNRMINKNKGKLSFKMINEINGIYPTKGMSEGSYKKAMNKLGLPPIKKYKEFQKFLMSQSIGSYDSFPSYIVPID